MKTKSIRALEIASVGPYSAPALRIRTTIAVALVMVMGLWWCGVAFAGEAKGTLTHKAKGKEVTVDLKHAYLITGPDDMEPDKIIRRLVFSTNDIGAKILSCQSMSCASGLITEGLAVDLVSGPRFMYWLSINDGLVQYSGTTKPANLQATIDQPGKLAGKLSFDDSAAGGPRVNIDFDTVLVKEFKTAR